MDNKELTNFVDNENDYIITTSTDDLENFDFSSNKEFDIDQNHELISVLKNSQNDESAKELIKLREAENIIEKDSYNFLNKDFVDKFNQEENNLKNMIKKFDPNIDYVRNLTEKQKDKIYDIAQYLFNSYQKKLNSLNFHFPLTPKEKSFLFKIVKEKLEYDQNEIFQLKELKDNYFDNYFEKSDKRNTLDTYINVNDLIILYHIISKYKVKGVNEDYYNFLNILTKIGERIKLFNAYNVIVQRLSNDFQLWGGSLSVEGELSNIESSENINE